MTMLPRPILMSEEPWYWAKSAPEKATSPLESIRPKTLQALVSMRIGTGCTDGRALFCTEEPVKQSNDAYRDDQEKRQRILKRKLAHKALGDGQRILVNAESLIGFVAHDSEVDRIKGELGEDSGKDGRNAAAGMQKPGAKTADQADSEGCKQSKTMVDPCADQHDRGSAAGGKCSVHSQIGNVQDPEREINADCHNTPDEPLRGCTGQGA